MADKEYPLQSIEIHHELLSASEREALQNALMNATVEGYRGFVKVMLLIMGFTAGGRVTVPQANALTAQAELLFTALCAIQVQGPQAAPASQPRGISQTPEDPLVAQIKAAQKKAGKFRPAIHMAKDGTTMQVIDTEGNVVT